ncbi:MAG: heme-binding protein [Planctomycetes bacterium]|nr:heme-binding protein [Planctomycetota bacterium]
MLAWLSRTLQTEQDATAQSHSRKKLNVEILEAREVPATLSLTGGILSVVGTPLDDRIAISLDTALNQVVVQDNGNVIGRFASASVTSLQVATGNGNDRIQVTEDVKQPAVLDGGNGKNTIIAGGGATTLIGGTGDSKLGGGTGASNFVGGSGNELIVGGTGTNTGSTGGDFNNVQRVNASNTITTNPNDIVLINNPNPSTVSSQSTTVITADEVRLLLLRATAASRSTDAIIAITDRNGRILGVLVEDGVDANIRNNPEQLTFAVDGAVALARTGAFFANNQAPLTSRTVAFISQSPITQREVESNPNDTNPNSTVRGPGYVAAVGANAHFPPGVPNTPEVDLVGIEHTNRDSLIHPGADGIKGTADDVKLPYRFNINPAFVPAGKQIFAPESYGFSSGIMPTAQARGIGTLPGGIPLYKNGELVGGIGVFFPGKTGYATEENSATSATYDPTKPDRAYEAEYIAFAAAGGSSGANASVGTIAGIPALPNFNLPNGRIDLVGITLDIFGPGGNEGVNRLLSLGQGLGVGTVAGSFIPVTAGADNTPGNADDVLLQGGLTVPDGWLVAPHDGVGITAAEVTQIITEGIEQAYKTRAAIRLPLNSSTRMVLAVTDRNGEVVGLFRMPDATIFSIDVAVAKARNVNYYADPEKLQPIDQLPGIAPGIAFTNRTFRFLSLPRYPSGAEGSPAGYFSVFTDGGVNPTNGLQVGPRLPASAYTSVFGHDSFNPQTNFRDKTNILNQNGIVFFPGSAPLYRSTATGGITLKGGFGVSGDGVDQDDVVTTLGQVGFEPKNGVLRSDEIIFRGVRLPYQKYDRNAQGGLVG